MTSIIKSLIKTLKREIKEKINLRKFKKDFDLFNSTDKHKRLSNEWKDIYPCLFDKTTLTPFDGHYIYHPAWAMRIISKIKPQKHVDISSTLHFCTTLSAFIPVDFYDFRPADLTLSNLKSLKADLTNLHFEDSSIQSLSCMHTIEHIGLGRYGDPIDPDGDLKAINELKRVCAKGGNLLLVVPVGIQKVLFNAHRIYNPMQIIKYFEGFHLKEFALITDSNEFIDGADLGIAANQTYGCGCFWFIKN